MRMDRAAMERMISGLKGEGAQVHLTPRRGLCLHGTPATPGVVREPSEASNQDDVDWLLARVQEVWPEGVPACPWNRTRARARAAGDGLMREVARTRLEPLPGVVARPMTDEEVIDAMDALVCLVCDEQGRGLRRRVIVGHVLTAWSGVRGYILNFASGGNGVQNGVQKKSTKKERR